MYCNKILKLLNVINTLIQQTNLMKLIKTFENWLFLNYTYQLTVINTAIQVIKL